MSAKVTLEFTRNQVKKAGINLKSNTLTSTDIDIINSFRGVHEPLMLLLIATIKRKKTIPQIVARRLKRLSSIEKKLIRFDDMNLARMQDIAGVRAIFSSINDVKKFVKEMEKTYKNNNNSFLLTRTTDYIQNPKNDGYRGIHQIFKYVKGNYDYALGLSIELQSRTLLQHYWATAVEVLGLKTSSNLKLGFGKKHYKEFFKLCSVLFSYKEKMPCIEEYKDVPIQEICNNILKIEEENNIFQTLTALAITSKDINDNSKGKHKYYVIKLDIANSSLSLYGYKEIEEAKSIYSMFENASQKDKTDVVLVSVSDVKKLKKAYPNYYLDSSNFTKNILNIMKTVAIA